MNNQIDSLSRSSTEPTPEQAPQPVVTPVETPVPPVTTESFEKMFPEPALVIAGPPNWVWWAVLVAASAVLGMVGYTLARHNIGDWLATSTTPTTVPTVNATSVPIATTEPTTAPTTAATATPAPTSLKSDVTLRVLNGTTTAGAAGIAARTLKTAGYTIRTTGNAKNQTYTSSYVYYQKGKDAEAKEVAAALKDYSPVLEESTLANPDNILVVIGKK